MCELGVGISVLPVPLGKKLVGVERLDLGEEPPGRDTWVGYWISSVVPDWPPERLGREPGLARSLGVLTPISEKTLLPPLSIAS